MKYDPELATKFGPKPKVLMACRNFFASHFQVGSHHLARCFLRAGFKVGFVSEAISPLHLLAAKKPEIRQRLASYLCGGKWQNGHDLWTYVPGAFVTPRDSALLRSEWISRNWRKTIFPDVVKKVKRAGFSSVDLIYLDNPDQSFWLHELAHKKSVLRIPDLTSCSDRATPALSRREREIAARASLVVYSAQELQQHVQKLCPRRSFLLLNGVEYKHFATPRKRPKDYSRIPQPIAIYVGTLDRRLDYELIHAAASALPDLSFVFIGPFGSSGARLRGAKNVYLMGPRPYERLPAYLQHANLGLIPFDVQWNPGLIHATNPLKLYQYFACALPVVSVQWNELNLLNSPALLCQTHTEFIDGIAKTLRHPPSPESLIDFAKSRDWQLLFESLMQQLEL